MRPTNRAFLHRVHSFTLSPDQKGIETRTEGRSDGGKPFTLSPDQKGIETCDVHCKEAFPMFTLSPDQKGIETGLP